MDKVRALFKVTEIRESHYHPDMPKIAKVFFQAATSLYDSIPEAERYHKFTPSGELMIQIDNPPAAEFFKPGQYYYLDFVPYSPE